MGTERRLGHLVRQLRHVDVVLGYNPKSKFAAESSPSRGTRRSPSPGSSSASPTRPPTPRASWSRGADRHGQVAEPPGADHDRERQGDVFPEETLVARLQAGQLDAGFFYTIEATAASIPTVPLTGQDLKATYTITVLKGAPNEAGAEAFVRLPARAAGPGRAQAGRVHLITPPKRHRHRRAGRGAASSRCCPRAVSRHVKYRASAARSPAWAGCSRSTWPSRSSPSSSGWRSRATAASAPRPVVGAVDVGVERDDLHGDRRPPRHPAGLLAGPGQAGRSTAGRRARAAAAGAAAGDERHPADLHRRPVHVARQALRRRAHRHDGRRRHRPDVRRRRRSWSSPPGSASPAVDPALEDLAATLGHGPLARFWPCRVRDRRARHPRRAAADLAARASASTAPPCCSPTTPTRCPSSSTCCSPRPASRRPRRRPRSPSPSPCVGAAHLGHVRRPPRARRAPACPARAAARSSRRRRWASTSTSPSARSACGWRTRQAATASRSSARRARASRSRCAALAGLLGPDAGRVA